MMRRKSHGDAVPSDWPARKGAARVLVENSDGAERWALERLLERSGYDVVVCGGPQTLEGGRCPLLAGRFCPAAAGADVVLSHSRPSDDDGRLVVRALKAEFPDVAVVVEIEAPRAGSVPDGCSVLPAPATSRRVVAAIDAVVLERIRAEQA